MASWSQAAKKTREGEACHSSQFRILLWRGAQWNFTTRNSEQAAADLFDIPGGWGYHVYPINKQLHSLQNFACSFLTVAAMGCPPNHLNSAWTFMFARRKRHSCFIGALGIHEAVLWGHSDGSVIAAFMGLMRPERCPGTVLEAFHYNRRKSVSREFFETMVAAPESFGERVAQVLAHEHGEGYWRELLKTEGRTWLEIAKLADCGAEDVYDGKLDELKVPPVLMHGACDPRTDPGEDRPPCSSVTAACGASTASRRSSVTARTLPYSPGRRMLPGLGNAAATRIVPVLGSIWRSVHNTSPVWG